MSRSRIVSAVLTASILASALPARAEPTTDEERADVLSARLHALANRERRHKNVMFAVGTGVGTVVAGGAALAIADRNEPDPSRRRMMLDGAAVVIVLGGLLTILGTTRLLDDEPVASTTGITAAPIVAQHTLGFGASGAF